MYVWFDALFSYLTPMLATPERRAFWPANVHLVGKDILRFHAVYWPAFLMAAGMSDDEIPKQIFAHGFLTFNGQKMSKSLRNTVKPVALAEAFGVDTAALLPDARHRLRARRRFQRQRSGAALQRRPRQRARQLAEPGAQAVREVRREGNFPRAASSRSSRRGSSPSSLSASKAAADAFDALQPHRALEAIWQVVGAANQYIDRAAPWAASKRAINAARRPSSRPRCTCSKR